MPFVRLVWVVASCNVLSLEAYAHFVDVNMLTAMEVTLIKIAEMP
jgi:hypothetical protein